MARLTASQISLMKQFFAQIGAVDSTWILGDIPVDQIGGASSWFTESFDSRLLASVASAVVASGAQGLKADEAIERLDALQTVPPGAVMAFAMSTPPTGWLECDGSAIDRFDYEALFNAIGTSFGTGDGSSTFNIPDLRGQFVRGWSHGVTPAVDPNAATRTASGTGGATGDNVGSEQADAFESHSHTIAFLGPAISVDTNDPDATAREVTTSDNTGATGGSETRPTNIYLMYCIKV